MKEKEICSVKRNSLAINSLILVLLAFANFSDFPKECILSALDKNLLAFFGKLSDQLLCKLLFMQEF